MNIHYSFVLRGFGYTFDCNAISGISPAVLSALWYFNTPYKLVSLTAIYADTHLIIFDAVFPAIVGYF